MSANGSPARVLIAALALLTSASATAADLLGTYQKAQQNDPQYAAARAQYRAAQEARPQARAAVLPQVNLSASVSENDYDGPTGNSQSFTSNEASLTLTQTLFNWRQFAGLDRASAQVAQAEAQLASAEQNLVTRVAQAYFDVLSAADGLRFAQAEKKAIGRQLEQAKQRFDVGLIPITDVKAAQASYDLATSREISAQNQVENAREALRTIINEPPGSLATLSEGRPPLDRPQPAAPEEWVQRALEQNPEYLAARSGAEAARYGIKEARAGHYPNVDLVARHSESEDSNGPGTGDITNNSIGVQVTLPLFSGFATTSQTRQAQAQFDQARSQVVQARRGAEQGTRDAYRGVEASISQVTALQQAVESNRAAVESTQAGFRVGTRTAVDVLNALRDLYGAQRDLADARYNYILNRLRLKQAAGTLTVEDVRLVNSWLSSPSD